MVIGIALAVPAQGQNGADPCDRELACALDRRLRGGRIHGAHEHDQVRSVSQPEQYDRTAPVHAIHDRRDGGPAQQRGEIVGEGAEALRDERGERWGSPQQAREHVIGAQRVAHPRHEAHVVRHRKAVGWKAARRTS